MDLEPQAAPKSRWDLRSSLIALIRWSHISVRIRITTWMKIMTTLHQQLEFREVLERMRVERTLEIQSKSNQSNQTISRSLEKEHHLKIQILVIKRAKSKDNKWAAWMIYLVLVVKSKFSSNNKMMISTLEDLMNLVKRTVARNQTKILVSIQMPRSTWMTSKMKNEKDSK